MILIAGDDIGVDLDLGAFFSVGFVGQVVFISGYRLQNASQIEGKGV